jgi:hypothetical protein
VFVRTGDGFLGVQPGEGQMQHCGTHLGADPPTMMALSQAWPVLTTPVMARSRAPMLPTTTPA